MLVVVLLALGLCVTATSSKIFGVGLSKTGTTSLGAALEQLGLNNLHMDRAFVPFLFPEGAYDFSGILPHCS